MPPKVVCVLVCLLISGISFSLQQSGPKAPSSFSALLDRKEQIARSVCSNFTKNFDNLPYDIPNIADRLSCYYIDGCDRNLEFKMPKYGCAFGFNYGNPESRCTGCGARSVSFEYSVSLFPTGTDGTQKYTPGTAVSIPQVRDFRCAIQDLRLTYRTSDSFSSKSGTCFRGFEYRNRSWFVSASYVSKNLLIIVDYSSVVLSSRTGGYSTTMSAIQSLIDSLNVRDKVALIMFSKKAIICDVNAKNGFVKADSSNKASMLACINQYFVETTSTISTGSYHSAALESAFGFIRQFNSSMVSCDTSIAFFGDADNINDESNPVNTMISQFALTKNTLPQSQVDTIRIFSFTVGLTGGRPNPLKAYPCLTGGLWIPLDPSDVTSEQKNDIRGIISPFFRFHSYRRLFESKIVWSEFYMDLLGVGNMTTAALPCFSSSGSFLGVVGVDVPATLFNYSTYPDADVEFKKRQQDSDGPGYCPSVLLPDSFVADLRGGPCNYCNQPCGTLAVMLGFIPAMLASFVVFVVISFYFYKRSLRSAEGKEEKEENNRPQSISAKK
ncbi:hypothetical protein FDP41_004522 [Naegleria fowleri]|uniref:VWFA domain-containing protein n=1 Tax=Naegleria fowleri TaxID=5763 RepID=A0A6A5BFK7_NAEFO|nr:uncharacterized protein FDP41_004522 [Naegleria fowleri]KAF0976623.1 hypothetical protein FDP41_004522 [Naegleria fowleri]